MVNPRGKVGPVTSGHIWAFLVVGFLLFVLVFSVYAEPDYLKDNPSARTKRDFRIESVYEGAVQATDIRTGTVVELRDPDLIRKCLTGELKKGDVVRI